jgi:hypothetical protein
MMKCELADADAKMPRPRSCYMLNECHRWPSAAEEVPRQMSSRHAAGTVRRERSKVRKFEQQENPTTTRGLRVRTALVITRLRGRESRMTSFRSHVSLG